MLGATLHRLAATKYRLAASALAVVLGVAFLAGTLSLTDTVRTTFDRLFTTVYGGTDAVVRATSSFRGPENSGTQRGRVDESLIATIRRVDGVADVEGSVLGYARIIDRDGDPLGNPATGAPTIGASWSTRTELNPFHLVDGRGPKRDHEVVIDLQSARTTGYEIGDTVTVLTQGPPRTYVLTGIAKFGDAASPAGATIAAFPLDVAQAYVATPGTFDSINVLAERGTSQHELRDRLEAALPNDVESLTGDELVRETQGEARRAMAFFTSFLLTFAVVALIVGAFLILNTFNITVAQRTRESALLRALGASRGQVVTSVLMEALLVAVVASAIGLAAGYGMAAGLKAVMGGLGFDVPARGIEFSARTALVSFVAGIVVTVGAAVSPARKASAALPIAALRSVSTIDNTPPSRLRVVGGAAMAAGGAASIGVGLFTSVSQTFRWVGAGALLVFLGVSVLGQSLAVPLTRVLGWPLTRFRGIPGELATENALRNPRRTATSSSALMIGVGLVAFITILAASTKASVGVAIDRTFTGDLVIDAGGGLRGGIDHGLAERVSRLPEIDSVSAIRIGVARVDGAGEIVPGLEQKSALRILNLQPRAGSADDLAADTIAVHESVAERKHLAIGDRVQVQFPETGHRTLRVALIYGESRLVGNYFLGMPAYEANFPNRLDYEVLLTKAKGISADTALQAVKKVARDYPGAKVLDQSGVKEQQAASVNQLLALVYALLALAIVIGVIGIGNTIALSILERTREVGLLRAVGMTQQQLRATIRWESVLIALEGTTLGLVIGLFFGWALTTSLHDEGVTELRAPFSNLVVIVTVAAIAGVLAAWPPSRRAARLNTLRAIATE